MAKVNKKNDAKSEVTLFNKEKVDFLTRINFDADMVSLTDLWKEAGSPKNKEPKFWLRQDYTLELIETLSATLNVISNHLLKIKRGKGGGTYAHKSIALAYAKYLDARLHVLVNEVFFQRIEEEKNPDLIVDRAIDTYKRKGKSDTWITKRIKGKAKRNEFTSCLSRHGVDSPEGFKKCTNAVYKPLYGGSTAIVRKKKNLPDTANIRDNMSEVELSAVEFIESLSKDNIERQNARGDNQCEIIVTKSAEFVAAAIIKSREPMGVF